MRPCISGSAPLLLRALWCLPRASADSGVRRGHMGRFCADCLIARTECGHAGDREAFRLCLCLALAQRCTDTFEHVRCGQGRLREGEVLRFSRSA